MLEWLKRHAWKACKRPKRFTSSNLVLSATNHENLHHLDLHCISYSKTVHQGITQTLVNRFSIYIYIYILTTTTAPPYPQKKLHIYTGIKKIPKTPLNTGIFATLVESSLFALLLQ